ncbi:MAG TPA: nitric-oxide reductase large subunit [Ignavibacteriales bacterium]|nr:nitric-oxide reductase large subunit [Ignavibacteriales bacterium]
MSLNDSGKEEKYYPEGSYKRGLIISKGWFQAAILVFIFGFFVLGLLAYWSYTEKPPIPEKVLSSKGEVLFTGSDIIEGQKIFLKNGLMQYGSILGHGAYLGPDFTTDYLRRASDLAKEYYGGLNSERAKISTKDDFKTNRYNPSNGTLVYSEAQNNAFRKLQDYYAAFFSEPTTKFGLRPEAIKNRADTDKLTAYFSWTAWLASALRPGEDYSYTNNWPPETAVGNTQTAEAVTWSVLSLIALLGGIGLMMAAFGRWKFIGWHGRENATLNFIEPGKVFLTPSQRSTAYFFLVMALLFLIQALLGGSIQHYRTELTNFFGFDLAKILPFNVARTWHLQLAIFWVATSFLAAGIFLAPLISQNEPEKQHWLAYGLLGALAIVVFGSLIGEYLGIFGFIGNLWNWFGNQGWEYLDLGRFWQILLSIGLVFWVAILYRSMHTRLKNEHMANMPWIFFFAALAIPAFYAVGLLASTGSNYTVADYWRWWVVHLWVEDFLELFTTVVVAYIFVLLGIVQERTALTLIFLDFILYSAGGVIGTMHHMYFSGAPVQHMALGAVFSAAEVVPLTFLTVEAWSFLQLGTAQISKTTTPFPHKWAVMFLVAVGFWNFLGAGIFGFLINLPIVSYYEIGTALTANHGHAAFMGVYGMLAVGLALFCLRYLIPADKWSDKMAKFSFWTLNIGLAWMCLGTLFPLGVIQLYHSVSAGYFEARSLKFLTSELNTIIEWIRLPGDLMVIIGVIPLIILTWRGVRYRVERVTEKPKEIILTEISEDEK